MPAARVLAATHTQASSSLNLPAAPTCLAPSAGSMQQLSSLSTDSQPLPQSRRSNLCRKRPKALAPSATYAHRSQHSPQPLRGTAASAHTQHSACLTHSSLTDGCILSRAKQSMHTKCQQQANNLPQEQNRAPSTAAGTATTSRWFNAACPSGSASALQQPGQPAETTPHAPQPAAAAAAGHRHSLPALA